jgi:hypothetical protein
LANNKEWRHDKSTDIEVRICIWNNAAKNAQSWREYKDLKRIQ